jgi:hypothetical protein
MRYERPAIERRVKVSGPVIAGIINPGSGGVLTAWWAPHARKDKAAADVPRRSR